MRAWFSTLILLTACASSGGSERRPLFDPGPLTEHQKSQLARAERLYRADDAQYPQLRDQLAGDPRTAVWLTRMFVRDVVWALERRPADQNQVLAAAAGLRHPVEIRARAQIRALGAAATTGLVEDLLKSEFSDRREVGIDLLAEVGAASVPAVEPLLASAEPRERRAAVKALGAIPASPVTLAALTRAASDPEFTVRADAVRGLSGGGAAQAGLLATILAEDGDPFVRRLAAETLATYPDRETAMALIGYLERCRRERDARGEQAAQKSLSTIAGSDGPRTVEAWRRWLQGFAPTGDRG